MGGIVRNCRLCKEPMESSPFIMCPTCLRDSELIRSFVQKTPHVTLEEISESTNISLEKIENMATLGQKLPLNLK